jgi:3'-phosphoadenosine 5'-phosphosulfate sulfotransferase (PAPS reductase)/FAD synthetase
MSATSSDGRDKTACALCGRLHLFGEMLEWARDLAQRLQGDVRVERRRIELLVPEQYPRLRGGRLWITRMSVFCSSRCVAKQCRSVCRWTGLSISAIRAAAWQARLS